MVVAEHFFLIGAWIRSTVGQHVLAIDIARLHTAQKRANGAKLLRRTKTLGRNALAPGVGQSLHALTGFLGVGLQHGLDAVRVKHTRQQIVDGDTPGRQPTARNTRHKTGQSHCVRHWTEPSTHQWVP
jgi:hypothetical protein